MKRIIVFIVAVFTCISLSIGASANGFLRELSYNDQVLEQYNSEMRNLINSKIADGFKIYYGEGISEPMLFSKQARAFSQTVNLPASGTSFDLKFNSVGQTITSPCLFYATSNCKMKIYMTSTIKYDPSEIKIEVVDQTTGKTIYSELEYFEEVTNILSLGITKGHSYYIMATSTQLPSNANILVLGE